MHRKARGKMIERREVTQGDKDWYDYMADCKNFWLFCENDDEDFIALVIQGLNAYLNPEHTTSHHNTFKKFLENGFEAETPAGIRTQSIFWDYASAKFKKMKGIAINKGIEDGKFWIHVQE